MEWNKNILHILIWKDNKSNTNEHVYFGFKCSKFYTKLLSHSIWLLLFKWKTKQNLLLGINLCAYCTRAFCEYEWMICWNLISKDSYKQFLRLHRYIASKGVPWRECVYVLVMSPSRAEGFSAWLGSARDLFHLSSELKIDWKTSWNS